MQILVRVDGDTKVVTRNFVDRETGKSQAARSQTSVYIVGASKFPLEIRLRLGADQPPFAPGDYDCEPGGLFQLKNDQAVVRYDLALVPIEKHSKAA